jgi:hypothetical protein
MHSGFTPVLLHRISDSSHVQAVGALAAKPPETPCAGRRRYWNTFLTYLGKARSGSLSVVRRAQQRRLLWQVGLGFRALKP